jgi:energy-coupling factor transporter ATP-binding protein EcfA2
MDAAPPGFPRELLSQPWPARLEYFRAYTMAHPRLVAAREALLGAIHGRAPNSLILVLGPTGVGKTTLRAKVEQMLTMEMLPELQATPGRLPVVSVECIAPESGSFSWRDHFVRLLLQMNEPLIDRKLNSKSTARTDDRAMNCLPNPRTAGADYHHAAEQALRFRRPVAVLLDEAQHLARISSGRRLSEQLDVIKSIANRTETVHVLFGTYELLAFRNLSAQLSRRSIYIHFPRYRADDHKDREMFMTVLRSFEQQRPVSQPPDLVHGWEYLYERSIGCVGVLKEWLVRALTGVSRRNASVLTMRDLQAHALSVSQCEKMLSETLEGEVGLQEDVEQSNRLRTRLGLSLHEGHPEKLKSPVVTIGIPSSKKQRWRPGQRLPTRDVIGQANANAATV